VEGQDDFASMGEVVRRRYARVLREVGENIQHPSPGRTGISNTQHPMGESSNDTRIDYGESQLSNVEMAEYAGRRTELPISFPDLIIVDGGKGQLSAACRELQQLGLHDVAIIGLAKEFEEIYRPGRPQPLRLPHDSGALQLLQRIRDEAHRFANSYHQLLMKRRVAESILDECPGVSQHRKQLLLQKFGSVVRLRRATVDEIASTSGVGRKLAEQVAQFLAERA
jgi:excinuclease ABC subunit C